MSALIANRFVDVSVDANGIAHILLSRAPVNAVHEPMYLEIAEVFNNPDRYAPGARAIVLSGAGKHFCGGHDLDEFALMTPQSGVGLMRRVREAFFAIQFCPLPVIGAVHGVALGTGLAIAASCDFVIAARDARFALPELTVGVLGGARHLARMAPEPLVRRMFMTGEPMTAQEFAAAGGAVTVCDSADLTATALRSAARIASFSPTAVRLAKDVLNRIETMELRAGYELEQKHTVWMSGHPDSKEALAAFREKRSAHYQPWFPGATL
jgi:enoyl-CoA hydratase